MLKILLSSNKKWWSSSYFNINGNDIFAAIGSITRDQHKKHTPKHSLTSTQSLSVDSQ